MKKWLKLPGILAILLFPFFAFATPSSVDRITDHIEPLIKTDYIKGSYFIATSTTNHSIFPYASTTAISTAVLCLTSDLPCRSTWPTGSAYPFPLPGNATSTLTQFNGGLTAYSTSTIGNGTQANGLTISGGATTTLNALFQGTLVVTPPTGGASITANGNSTTAGTSLTLNDTLTSANTYTAFINPASASGANVNTVPLTGTFSVGNGASGGLLFTTRNAAAPIRFYTGGNSLTTNFRMTILGSGNVGIATSTPYSPLSVWGGAAGNIFEAVTAASSSALTVSATGNGTTTVTGLTVNGSATSTSNVGWNLSGGCFAINNVCIVSGAGALTALGSGWATTTGSTITFSTSTLSFNGLTVGQTIVPAASSLLFTPAITGTLNNTGLTNSSITVNGTPIALGAAGTISAASSTLLTDTNSFAGLNTFTRATTTNLTIGTNWYVPQTGVLIGNGAGALVTAGATQTCTNQFFRSLSNLYSVTCASVSLTADVTGILPIANGGTNANAFTTTGNGVYWDGTRLVTAPLTSKVTYPYASTTAITVSGTASTSLLRIDILADGCLNIASGLVGSTGSACGSGGGGANSKWATTTAPDAQGIFLNSGNRVGIGTSTMPLGWSLQIATSSASPTFKSQLVLTDTNAGTNAQHWNFTSVGGQLRIGTSTDLFATSTYLSISNGGRVGIGTLTPTAVNANSWLTVAGNGAVDIIASTTDDTTSSTSILEAYASGSRVFIGAHGANQNTTQYGITVGGWAEIGAINSSFGTSNGLLIGTRTTAKPIVFGNGGQERMRVDSSGFVGVGSTTPWALLAVASSTWGQNPADYLRPLFAVATSSNNFGGLSFEFATSSTLSGTASGHESGLRMWFGRLIDAIQNWSGPLDQVSVNGRLNTPGWRSAGCELFGAGTQLNGGLIADTAQACGVLTFAEDADMNSVPVTPASSGTDIYVNDSPGTIVSNNGGGYFYGSIAAPSLWIRFASSTPVFEAAARVINGVSTTSRYYIGFSNTRLDSTSMELEPTAGCYFVSSSTLPNYQAQCRTSIANTTTVDTGVASTTGNGTLSNAGRFYQFRLEAGSNVVKFYMSTSTDPAALVQVAQITTNIPDTTSLMPSIYFGYISGLTAVAAPRQDIMMMRLWWRYLLPTGV